MNKNYIVGGIIAVLVVIGIIVYSTRSNTIAGAVSPSGAYNNGLGLSTITITPSAITATSTTILNTGASDRFVTGIAASCSGVTTISNSAAQSPATWTLIVGTTSAATTNVVASIFSATIATSSASSYVASTTGGIATAGAVSTNITATPPVWQTNTYLNFAFNATSSATCTVAATWLPL